MTNKKSPKATKTKPSPSTPTSNAAATDAFERKLDHLVKQLDEAGIPAGCVVEKWHQ